MTHAGTQENECRDEKTAVNPAIIGHEIDVAQYYIVSVHCWLLCITSIIKYGIAGFLSSSSGQVLDHRTLDRGLAVRYWTTDTGSWSGGRVLDHRHWVVVYR